MLEPILTPTQVSRFLHFSPRSLKDPRFRRRIGLRAVKVGRALRFTEADVRRVLKPESLRPESNAAEK